MGIFTGLPCPQQKDPSRLMAKRAHAVRTRRRSGLEQLVLIPLRNPFPECMTFLLHRGPFGGLIEWGTI